MVSDLATRAICLVDDSYQIECMFLKYIVISLSQESAGFRILTVYRTSILSVDFIAHVR